MKTIELYLAKADETMIMFNKHFIKTEIFPRTLTAFLKQNLDKRILGDYEIGFKASEEDAQQAIENTELIIKTIKEYLVDFMR